MKHGIFYGSHDVTLDSKNRVSVPSEIRKCIDKERDGEAFFLIVGINRKIWLYTERMYEEMASQQISEMVPGDDALAMDQIWYGQADKVAWDPAGRILIPDKILRKTGTGKEVSIVGLRNHCEIWNRADWAAREEELDRQKVEISLRAKQIGHAPAATPLLR